jgi:hypothetical protein
VITPARVRRPRLDRRPAGLSAAERAARGKAASESVPGRRTPRSSRGSAARTPSACWNSRPHRAFAGASPYPNQGQRVVAGQRLMQASSDIFLGWHRARPRSGGQASDFYLRQLRDWKFSLVIEGMGPSTMLVYGQLCGRPLARAHARSGDRIAIAAYLGTSDVFDKALAEFAAAYAEQNERDYASLGTAVASGRVTAQRGV